MTDRKKDKEELERMFVKLCEMYSAMGNFLLPIASIFEDPKLKNTLYKKDMERILEQHREIGEQLKNMGILIDVLKLEGVMEEGVFTTNN